MPRTGTAGYSLCTPCAVTTLGLPFRRVQRGAGDRWCCAGLTGLRNPPSLLFLGTAVQAEGSIGRCASAGEDRSSRRPRVTPSRSATGSPSYASPVARATGSATPKTAHPVALRSRPVQERTSRKQAEGSRLQESWARRVRASPLRQRRLPDRYRGRCRVPGGGAIEEAGDDPASFAQAFGTIARSGNSSELARRVGMSREGLSKALSGEGNSSFTTTIKVARALALRIRFESVA